MKTWKTPTPEQVDKVHLKLARPGAHRYFFAGLQNPNWVEPLRERGYFSSPPEVRRDEANGITLMPDWPEANYLARVAGEVPGLVTDIVLNLPIITNERVQQSLVGVALQLPPAFAARLVDRVVAWVPARPLLTLSMQLPHLVVRLAEGGQFNAALKLASALFEFERQEPTSTEGEIPVARPRTSMDLWEYNEAVKVCIPKLGKINPLRTIYFVSDLLESALFAADLIRSGANPVDVSYLRAQDLDNADDTSLTSFEGILARTLSRLAIEALRSEDVGLEKVLYAVERKKWSINKAVSLYALSEAAPHAIEQAKTNMLDRALFDSGECRQQYARLLRTRFGELSPDEKQTVFDWIDAGPDFTSRIANYERFHGHPPTDDEIAQSRKVWLRDRLLWLEQYLPPDKAELLKEMLSAVGPPEQEPTGKAFWWGPSSPMSDEDFNAMPVGDVIQFLRSWVPSDEKSASRTGLARQLQAAARERHVEFAPNAEAFIGLPPTYVHHLIWGLEEAARQGSNFSWDPLLALCDWMVRQPRGQEPDVPIPLRGDEESWAGARRATARLIEIGLDKKLIPTTARTAVWGIIAELAEDPEPSPQDEDARTTGFDPTTASVNRIRGQAMHAAMKYARWLWLQWDHDGDPRDRSFDHMPEVRQLLDRHLDLAVEKSVAIRSVYGQYYPLLTFLDPNWARGAVPKIFPDDAALQDLWWAAWLAYIQFGGAYDNVFAVLRPQYGIAIERLSRNDAEAERDRSGEQLGSHLMVFYWRGLISLASDDLIARFMTRAAPRLRKQALEFIGRSLVNSPEKIPKEVVDRLIALWESRVLAAKGADNREPFKTELSSFGIWFLSGKFDDNWAMGRLLEALDLAEGDAFNAFPVIKRLADLASSMPEAAVQCLDRLLFGPKANWLYMSGMAEVGSILRAAIASGVQPAQAGAIRIINRLAERGDMTYRELAT
jgi:hypothetical protein